MENQMTMVWCTITPQTAEEWLKKNMSRNRKLDRARVAFLADQMQRGLWHKTGNAIQFDTDGNLQDGQTRLTACVKAGVPFDSWVTFNVPTDSYLAQNCGKPQSYKDVMKYNDVKNCNAATSIIVGYLIAKKGRIALHNGQMNKISNDDVLAAYTNNKKIIDFVASKLVTYCGRTRIITTKTAGTIALYCILEKGYDIGKVLDFFNKVTSFTDMSSPTCTALREHLRIISDKRDTAKKVTEPYKRRVTAFAIDKYLNHDEVSTLTGFFRRERTDHPFTILDIRQNNSIF